MDEDTAAPQRGGDVCAVDSTPQPTPAAPEVAEPSAPAGENVPPNASGVPLDQQANLCEASGPAPVGDGATSGTVSLGAAAVSASGSASAGPSAAIGGTIGEHGPYVDVRLTDRGIDLRGGLYHSDTTDVGAGRLRVGEVTDADGSQTRGVAVDTTAYERRDGADRVTMGSSAIRAGETRDKDGNESNGLTASTAIQTSQMGSGPSGTTTTEIGGTKVQIGKFQDGEGNTVYGNNLEANATKVSHKWKDASGEEEYEVVGTIGASSTTTAGAKGVNATAGLGAGVAASADNKRTGGYLRGGLSAGPSAGARAYYNRENQAGEAVVGGGFDYGPVTFDGRTPVLPGSGGPPAPAPTPAPTPAAPEPNRCE